MGVPLVLVPIFLTALVALGAAAFTAVGVENFPATAEKVIAGVVTGIGFLGAGVILRGSNNSVRGLTTAASPWGTAAIGILAGAGELLIAVVTAGLVLVVLESPNLPILRRIHHPHPDPDESTPGRTGGSEPA
jgi:putative Mg2+ transporter-C (MgtC) family protein